MDTEFAQAEVFLTAFQGLPPKEQWRIFSLISTTLFTPPIQFKIEKEQKWVNLEAFLAKRRFSLPTDYTFNREELYER